MDLLDGRLFGDQTVGDRKRQEDDFGIVDLRDGEKEIALLVLADGMGGHAGGAEASAIAISKFIEFFEGESSPFHARLAPALAAANIAVGDLADENTEWEGMGCTFTAALITEKGMWWISVGDSPLYLIQNDKLVRLNDDHSMRPILEEMVMAGRLTTEKLEENPNRNALRSAVSGDAIKLVDCPSAPFPLMPGDKVLLASDGLDTLRESQILKVVNGNTKLDATGLVGNLLKAVEEEEKPHQDNTTAILYLVEASSVSENSSTTKVPGVVLLSNLLKPTRYTITILLIAVLLSLILGIWLGAKFLSQPAETSNEIIEVPEKESVEKSDLTPSELSQQSEVDESDDIVAPNKSDEFENN